MQTWEVANREPPWFQVPAKAQRGRPVYASGHNDALPLQCSSSSGPTATGTATQSTKGLSLRDPAFPASLQRRERRFSSLRRGSPGADPVRVPPTASDSPLSIPVTRLSAGGVGEAERIRCKAPWGIYSDLACDHDFVRRTRPTGSAHNNLAIGLQGGRIDPAVRCRTYRGGDGSGLGSGCVECGIEATVGIIAGQSQLILGTGATIAGSDDLSVRLDHYRLGTVNRTASHGRNDDTPFSESGIESPVRLVAGNREILAGVALRRVARHDDYVERLNTQIQPSLLML